MGLNVFPELKKTANTDFVVLDKWYVDKISDDMVDMLNSSKEQKKNVLIDFDYLEDTE